MSHSSLSAQLASLHSKHGAGSRQHGDSVGRGIHHSAKLGHSVITNNVKHKPSVLHPDSRSAAIADVPITTLRENAIASLQFLSQHSSQLFDMSGENLPWQTLFGPKSIKYERGVNSTETNAKFDGFVKDALYLLSTALGDAASSISGFSGSYIQLGANIPSSVLHALEYLIQKYYVHVHNAENMLVSFLPHHESFLFDRILQLVNLAQIPHWSFLRPFGTAKGLNGVPRTVLAKWAASTKDNGGGVILVKQISELGKKAARIHVKERLLGTLESTQPEARRGISFVISFAAATLAETFHIQHSTNGSIDESTLRCMIPIILSAVEPLKEKKKNSGKTKTNWSLGTLCQEWRSFGHIMISLVMEKCDLNQDLCEVLVECLVNGSIEFVQLLRRDESRAYAEDVVDVEVYNDHNADDFSSLMQYILESTSGTLLVIINILNHFMDVDASKRAVDTESCFLPIVMNDNKSSLRQTVGYKLTAKMFNAIMKLPFLAISFGHLVSDKEIECRPLIASLVIMSISKTRCNSHNFQEHFNIILELMKNQPPLKAIWIEKGMPLITSVCSFIIHSSIKLLDEDDEINKIILQSLPKCLQSISQIDSAACDAGITHAVTMISSISDNELKKRAGENVEKLLHLSGHLKNEIIPKKIDLTVALDNDLDHLLPPRMALEHPNVTLRMNAIAKLEADTASKADANDIASSLIRRYVSDDDVSVATASANALGHFYSKGYLSDFFFIQPTVMKDLAFGLQKWTSFADQTLENDEKVSTCLCSSMHLASLAAWAMICHSRDDDEKRNYNSDGEIDCSISLQVGLLLEIILSQVSKEDKTDLVSEKVIGSLLRALGEDANKATNEDALRVVCENKHVQDVVWECNGMINLKKRNDEIEKSKQILWFFLRSCTEKKCNLKVASDLIPLLLTTSISLTTSYSRETMKNKRIMKELDILRNCLETCLSSGNLDDISETVEALSTVSSHLVYDNVSKPIITKAMNEWKEKARIEGSVALLLETLTRPTLHVQGLKRLLAILETQITSEKKLNHLNCGLVLIASLSLCSHPELEIRKESLNMIEKLGEVAPKADKNFQAVRMICASKSSVEANILMDGSNALPALLRKVLGGTSKDISNVKKFLFEACKIMGLNALRLAQGGNELCADGFFHATSIVLSAMEAAGEEYFSLSDRWSKVGKELFDSFLNWSRNESLKSTARNLLECVVVMTKGVTIEVDSVDHVVITSEPKGAGRRTRSYSVGMSDGISYIQPYPIEMANTIVNLLSMAAAKRENTYLFEVCEVMHRLVLCRTSWSNGIFVKIEKTQRKKILLSLLNLRSYSNIVSAGLVLMGLDINASEFLYLLNSKDSKACNFDSVGLLAFTVVMECVRERKHDLRNDSQRTELISVLFDRLKMLSTKKDSDLSDDTDYTRSCIIQALLSLNEKQSHESTDNIDTDVIRDRSTLLAGLLGEYCDRNDMKPLLTSKSKTLTLQLLTSLCALSPATVVSSLIPAMINTMTSSEASENSMMAIIPTYCKHASFAGLSLMDLLEAFINHCQKGIAWRQKVELYSHLNRGLLLSEEADNSALATVITVYLASDAVRHYIKKSDQEDNIMDSDETPLAFAAELLKQVDVYEQIRTSQQLLHYVGKILLSLTDQDSDVTNDSTDFNNFFVVSNEDIFSFITRGHLSGKSTDQEKLQLMWLVITILDVIQTNIYDLPTVKRSIRRSDDRQAGVCLKVWQELLSLQSQLMHYRFQDDVQSSEGNQGRTRFWMKVEEGTGGILSTIQRLLPTPHFLASVSSLVNDSDVDLDIQRKALILLAERSVEVNPTSPEATLFLEMMPDLVNLAKKKHSNEDGSPCHDIILLRQTSLRVIDQMAKSLGLSLSDEKMRRKRSSIFLPAFQLVTIFLRHESSSTDFNIISDDIDESTLSSFIAESQILSSALLCAATLITLLKALCVAKLQELVKPVINILTRVSDGLCNNSKIAVEGAAYQALALIQLSIIRTLVAVAESVPQFLTPYLESLLSPSCLPSIKLIQNNTDEFIAISNMTDRLMNAIGTRSQVHQLVPIISKAMKKCFSSKTDHQNYWKESLLLLKILSISVSQSSRSDLGPLAGKVLNCLVQVYGHDCNEGRHHLLNEANDTLLSLVMKLSESQLRLLYGRLREWRGDLDTSAETSVSACRRFAFWSLSAAICQKLQNIFLPCMSSVVGDMIKELEYTVSCLCNNFSRTSKGNKRQKNKEENTLPFQNHDITPLQPLLLCFESALKADAHDGGNWIRAEDGQRYRLLLDPIGKLLQATFPSNISGLFLDEDDNQSNLVSSYEILIQGIGAEEQGNVIQTITALAVAAGNEQLWKPLNHALLDACGNDHRTEVRKTGINALLSIIQSLGEEYMVLLPECLPVLSELLEDDDEEIVAIAKECIRQGEDLLGESLEDSLR